jgi:hypothetical protein
VENCSAALNLVVATGRIGRQGCGYAMITGQGNGQGGREQGQKADQLPGSRDIENPDHRRYIAGVWGVPEESLPHKGLSVVPMFEAIHDGRIKALLSFCFNPAVSLPGLFTLSREQTLNLLVTAGKGYFPVDVIIALLDRDQPLQYAYFNALVEADLKDGRKELPSIHSSNYGRVIRLYAEYGGAGLLKRFIEACPNPPWKEARRICEENELWDSLRWSRRRWATSARPCGSTSN